MVSPDLIDAILAAVGLHKDEYLVDVRWPLAWFLILFGIYWIELR